MNEWRNKLGTVGLTVVGQYLQSEKFLDEEGLVDATKVQEHVEHLLEYTTSSYRFLYADTEQQASVTTPPPSSEDQN